MTTVPPRVKMDASGAAPGPVTGAVFKTVCGAMLSSWVGSTPMPLRHSAGGRALAGKTRDELPPRIVKGLVTAG
jgi:hypothetical protein